MMMMEKINNILDIKWAEKKFHIYVGKEWEAKGILSFNADIIIIMIIIIILYSVLINEILSKLFKFIINGEKREREREKEGKTKNVFSLSYVYLFNSRSNLIKKSRFTARASSFVLLFLFLFLHTLLYIMYI